MDTSCACYHWATVELWDNFFSIVYSYFICQRLVYHRCMSLSLGILSCSTDLYFCFCSSNIWFWWPYLCSIVLSQGVRFLQLLCCCCCCSFDWIFGAEPAHLYLSQALYLNKYISCQKKDCFGFLGSLCFCTNFNIFVLLVLWKIPLVIW